jgi:hypothetical protein
MTAINVAVIVGPGWAAEAVAGLARRRSTLEPAC